MDLKSLRKPIIKCMNGHQSRYLVKIFMTSANLSGYHTHKKSVGIVE